MSVPAPALPDYLTSPNAVFSDEDVEWRYGRAPDYTKTRKVWEEGRTMNHAAGSLPQLVENLVKNWEVEASFKSRLQDWRTIDHENYTFAMNGGSPQSAEHMLKVGTYNAIIAPNEYYSPENSDFASSHKTFKRMMPTFAWEVIEVYSGPPTVAFRWRHWGVMKNDYVGFNDKGEKVTAKAHGGPIEIFGVTVAQVDDKIRMQAVHTWMDPLAMFRLIAPYGVINKEVMNEKVEKETALADVPSHDGQKIAEEYNQPNGGQALDPVVKESVNSHTYYSNGLSDIDLMSPSSGCPFAGRCSASNEQQSTDPESNGQVSYDSDATVMAAEDKTTGAESLSMEVPVPETLSTLTNGPSTSISDGTSHVAEDSADQGAEMEIDEVQPSPNQLIIPSISGVKRSNSTTNTGEGASKVFKETLDADVARQHRPHEDVARSIYSSAVTGNVEDVLATGNGQLFKQETLADYNSVDTLLESSAAEVHPHPQGNGSCG